MNQERSDNTACRTLLPAYIQSPNVSLYLPVLDRCDFVLFTNQNPLERITDNNNNNNTVIGYRPLKYELKTGNLFHVNDHSTLCAINILTMD